ncbi:ABC transporter ATP-binding protein [Clostridium hydrogeniformans]|uniref:ABC transporter ATP-binding protein n=1 Tax=Clostridium hydrogeniformans TaxID=349933 RepID=UPI0004838674|nr:ABC transporter ATP-binding protein [Clostridium hydrogeniformans]
MLEIKDLCKYYDDFKAVDNLNLKIPKGEIFGFVGPNGAGKSTTMKIICGLLDATSGQVYVDDIDALKNSRVLKRKIGYMPDFFGVYDDLKVTEYLEFYASIYGIKGLEAKKVCNDLLELVDLTHKRDFYVDSLSRGMKQRLCLARSLVHNPDLLVLDEPASGMDPRARIEMKEILKTLKSMGKTIIISSHILSELSELCSSLGIIEKGRFVVTGTVEEIMLQVYGSKKIKLKALNNLDLAEKLLKEETDIKELITMETSNEIEFLSNGNEEALSKILNRLIVGGVPLVSFSEIDGNLEDIFLKVTKEA